MASGARLVTNLGPYALLGELGRGGMGVVFKARDTRDGRAVAIKLILGGGNQNDRSRVGLVREAGATASLRHPHIVSVYDVGQHAGNLYAVMEYLEGTALDRLLRRNWPLPMRQSLRVVAELCDALEFAHNRGIVHRDIKPANIFILKDGSAKVLDFGLAALAQISRSKHEQGGTVPYMSPEQVRGAELDGRTDVWSAGVTLYQVVTGELPFTGPTVDEVFRHILNAEVPSLREAVPLRDELGHLLRLALHKERERRLATAREFAFQLRGLIPRTDGERWAPTNAEGVLPKRIDATTVLSFSLPSPQAPAERESADRENAIELNKTDVNLEGGTTYRVLDLGFMGEAKGSPAVHVGKYPFMALRWKIREFESLRIQIFLSAVLLWSVVETKVPIVAALAVIGAVWLSPVSVDLGTWLADKYATYPRCRTCGRPLLRRSVWTRFVKSRTEVSLGYRDCIAALKSGYWEDAAKLLCIHGREQTSWYASRTVDAPWRYRLEFFECPKCMERIGRLTADELVGAAWYTRPNLVWALHGEAVADKGLLRRVINPIETGLLVIGGILRQIVLDGSTAWDALKVVGVSLFLLAAICGLLEISFQFPFRVGPRAKSSSETKSLVVRANQAYYGFGGKTDLPLAAKYYRKAAESGDAESANRLGEMFEEGMGVPVDVKEAARWYEIAAKLSNARAQYNLGRLYEEGRGVTIDAVKAAEWYKKAAAGNDRFAFLSLGGCYENGIGLPKNVNEALKWYDMAGKSGEVEGVRRASKLRAEMRKVEGIH